ncbi:hypothetical protein IQ244_20020 [Nostoc sp. LEGE 06077]|nr:hypothetical protein [Nostoc sp. LEGE 06077]
MICITIERKNIYPTNRRTPDSEAIIYPSMFTEDGQPIEDNIPIIEEAIAQKIQLYKNNQS